MGESQDDTLRSNATIMKNNILYRPEYRDIFVTIMRNYNEVVSSRALLRDIVEMVHAYLRLVEHLCKKKGRVLVQGKRKKRGSGRRKKSRKETENDPVVLSTDQVWNFVCIIFIRVFWNVELWKAGLLCELLGYFGDFIYNELVGELVNKKGELVN